MIDDVSRLAEHPVRPSDTLVIGSGAAGLALAERLAVRGVGVTVLESGPDLEASDDAQAWASDLNEGSSSGLAYRMGEGRSRTLGGTTALWHGQCMRMHEIDLAPRPWVDHSGWPLTRADLDPYYDEAESWFDVVGRSYGAERWQEYPDLPPLAWDAEFLLHDFTEYTPDPMVGRVRRDALASDPRIRLIVNATVTKIVVDRDRPTVRATGVEIADPQGRRHTVAARRVILAAGGLENPRLLQLSDPDGVGLGAGREHTGRYLQDHPVIRTAEVLADDHRVLQDRYIVLHQGRHRLFPKVRLAPAVQRRYGLLDATAIFVHDHEQPALDAARRLVLSARSHRRPEHPVRDLVQAAQAPKPVLRDTYRRYVRGLASGAVPSHVWVQVWVEQAPDADRRVVLGNTVDRLGLRRAEVRWSATDQELDTSRRITQWIGADLERLGIGRLRELPAMTDDDAWRSAVADAFHPAGTTRMARSAGEGVVDANLQVHGVEDLHVVGGSVFPTSGYANPTLTIVAMALRLGDHLAAAAGERAA